MPFHFWSVNFFVLGCIVGSFLNVVIYRLPLEQSIVSPPSHCPHCNYSIPWYLNIPLFTWLYLKGKCANCGAVISIRYFLVELLTGIIFLSCWLMFGHQSWGVAVVYCIMLAGLTAATFIDFEHLIIPDQITIGGIGVGFLLSLVVPALHGAKSPAGSLPQSIAGIAVGGGIIYLVLRLGKLLFGKQKIVLEPGSKIIFTENCLVLPDGEIHYEEVFYRKSDTIELKAATVELADRCYKNVAVRLRPSLLKLDDEEYNPEDVSYLEAVADELTLPREAMGLGDVKFMAAIGAFLGWQAVLFSLMASSVVGSIVGVTLVAMKKEKASGRIPYGPYIALGAVIWIFGGSTWWHRFWNF